LKVNRIGQTELPPPIRGGTTRPLTGRLPPRGSTPGFLRRYVEDADAVHRQAVTAGGTSVTDVTHLYFGDRVGRVRDPLGNLWWIQTRVEDVSPEEMRRRLGDPTFTKAMEYVTSAEFFPGRPSEHDR
jgi:hypothetical protein